MFKVLQPSSSSNQEQNWKTTECPGQHFTIAEQFTYADFNQAIHSAYAGADRIVADTLAHVRAQRATSTVAEFRRQIEATADSLPSPNEPFTSAEADEWLEKFKRMTERLEALEAESKVHTGTVERLSRELEELRKQAPDIPKKAWLKKAGTRSLTFLNRWLKTGQGDCSRRGEGPHRVRARKRLIGAASYFCASPKAFGQCGDSRGSSRQAIPEVAVLYFRLKGR